MSQLLPYSYRPITVRLPPIHRIFIP